MADPTKYEPHFNYSGWEAAGPKRPKPGAELDIDFANIARSVDETIDALKDIRRSDGKLKNGIVDKDALDESSRELWESAETAAENAKGSEQSAAGSAASAGRSAEAARGYVSDAVSQGNVPIYASVATVEGLNINPNLTALRTNGYYATGDGGGALYKRVSSEPSHNSKVQSADGSWWTPVVPFGYAFDSVSDMQASRLVTPGARVRTLGYYIPGDGGGNDYEIVAAGTGTDDGGSFIDLSGSGLQAKGLFPGGVFNVKQFGAKSSPEDSTASFQAAIDFAPDYGGKINILDNDSYKVHYPSLNIGTKSIIWEGSSVVNGSGNFNYLPGINRGLNRNYHTASSEPLLQEVLSRKETSQYHGALLRLHSSADYNQDNTTTRGTSISLEIDRNAGSSVKDYQWGIVAKVRTDQEYQDTSTVGVYSRVEKTESAEGRMWGMAISAINRSTVGTHVVGMECNARAVGPMGSNRNRVGLDCIVSTVADEPKADFDAIIKCMVNGTKGPYGNLTADSAYGVKVLEEEPGVITNSGVYIQNTGLYGLRTDGTKSVAEIRIDGNSPWGIDIAGDVTSGAMRIGRGKPIVFTDIRIQENIGGAFVISRQGQNVLSITDAASPLNIKVGGEVKTVTQGPADSGGVGYRVLRVAN